MLGPEAWRRLIPTIYYDSQNDFPVPDAPWMRGDDPELGKVHLDIYIGGWSMGPIVDHRTGLDRQMDGSARLDDKGNYPLTDPSRRNQEVFGWIVNACQDGHNGSMRYALAF